MSVDDKSYYIAERKYEFSAILTVLLGNPWGFLSPHGYRIGQFPPLTYNVKVFIQKCLCMQNVGFGVHKEISEFLVLASMSDMFLIPGGSWERKD